MKNRTRINRAAALILTLCLAFSVSALAAEQERTLSIEGARMQGELMHVYFQAITKEPLTQEAVSATLNEATLEHAELHPYTFADAGVTWCVITDLSSSESGRAMRDAKDCAQSIAEKMLPYDKGCAVAAAPADTSIGLLKDKQAMLDSIDALTLNPRDADIYDTVGRVIQAAQQDGESTARKCVLLLTDAMGAYEGDAQEAKAIVEEAGVPVYVIALLYGTSDNTRQQNAKKLSELASASPGGTFYATDSAHTIEDGVAPILQFRENGYTLVLTKEDIRSCTDADSGTLVISAKEGALTLTDTFQLDLSEIPAVADETPAPVEEASPSPDIEAETTDVQGETTAPASLTIPWIVGIAAASAIVAALLVLLILRGKTKRRATDDNLGSEAFVRMDRQPDAYAHDEPKLQASLRLEQLQRETEAPLELDMQERLVIGSDPKRAQLILDGTDGVACILTRQAGGLFIEPGDVAGEVLLNNRPVNEATPVASSDLIRLGQEDYILHWQG